MADGHDVFSVARCQMEKISHSDLVANLRCRVFSCSRFLSSLGRVCSLTKIAKTSRSTENKERLLRIHMLKSVDNCDRDCLTTKHEMGCSKTDGLM